MRVVIHQPNFVPWHPFFQKMAVADKFVILSRCQFEKGKYQNRFHLKDQWYTMSVNRGLESIRSKRYVTPQADWDRIKRKLPQYRRILDKFDICIGESLWITNTKIIFAISEVLGITTDVIADPPTTFTGTDRLVEICRYVGADTYLAGQSGANYMEPDKFAEAGIKVEYQDLAKADKRHILEVLDETI